MILSNLIDKTCKVNGELVKIVAIYQYNRRLMFVVSPLDGNLKCVQAKDINLDINGLILYKVIMNWDIDRKIVAIKLYREYSGKGLAEAKKDVEAGGSSIILKSHVTESEALRIQSHVNSIHNGIAATIVPV